MIKQSLVYTKIFLQQVKVSMTSEPDKPYRQPAERLEIGRYEINGSTSSLPLSAVEVLRLSEKNPCIED